MVVHGLTDDEADRIFQALADRTRRDVVTRVLSSEQSVSALAERYAMSFAAVQRHVAVLERAGLVRKQRRGREQLVSADVDVIHQANRLLDAYENLWQQRAARRRDPRRRLRPASVDSCDLGPPGESRSHDCAFRGWCGGWAEAPRHP